MEKTRFPGPIAHTRFFQLRGFVGGLVLLPCLVLISVSRPLVYPETLLDEVCESIGWVLLALYATCRIWATIYVGGRKDAELQTEGIYSVTRNPLYFGSTCFALAGAFFMESPLLLGVALLTLGYYLFKVIPSEEAVLRDRFGASFVEYTRRTPRFLPRLDTYRSGDAVSIDLPALKRETRRLWGAVLLPIVSGFMEVIRVNPHWPHWFRFL